eukprot:792323-Pyramimonas_sp.AAC.2
MLRLRMNRAPQVHLVRVSAAVASLEPFEHAEEGRAMARRPRLQHVLCRGGTPALCVRAAMRVGELARSSAWEQSGASHTSRVESLVITPGVMRK